MRAARQPSVVSDSRALMRAAATVIVWCLIFGLELGASLTAFVAIRMFVFRKFVVTGITDVQIQGSTTQPQLFFACGEQNLDQVQSILSNDAETAALKNLRAGLAVALPDFTPRRAQIVRRLNAAGIPAIAWLLLPKEQGYYMNAANAPAAAVRFDQFQQWTTENALGWDAVGLDIEPDVRDFDEWSGGHRARILLKLLWRYADIPNVRRAQEAYVTLVARIQSQGYAVQTYQMPFLVNGRKANSTLFRRLSGIVDVRSNLEVLMLYSSSVRSMGAAMIWRFGPDAQAIAVGSTEPGEGSPALDWAELSRDLLVASHFTRILGVYDLEGSVRQGYLPRLETMNWGRSVVIPAQQIRQITLLGEGVQTASWAASHWPYFAVVILLVDAWMVWRWRSRPGRAKAAA
jgi:hypothetical protein